MRRRNALLTLLQLVIVVVTVGLLFDWKRASHTSTASALQTSTLQRLALTTVQLSPPIYASSSPTEATPGTPNQEGQAYPQPSPSAIPPTRRPPAAAAQPVPQTHSSTRAHSWLPVPLVVTYRVEQGLCNQLFTHINVLALLRHLSIPVTLVIPPSHTRSKFSSSHPSWSAAPASQLLDMARMAEHWRGQGVAIAAGDTHLTTACERLDGERLLTPAIPWSVTLPEAAQKLRSNLTAWAAGRARPLPPCLHLWLGYPFAFLDQRRSTAYLQPAAEGLFYAPVVQQAAEQVVGRLLAVGAAEGGGQHGFMGVHLRIEPDWAEHERRFYDPSAIPQDPLQPYITQMRGAGFNASSLVYVASGIFTYWNSSGETVRMCMAAGPGRGCAPH